MGKGGLNDDEDFYDDDMGVSLLLQPDVHSVCCVS